MPARLERDWDIRYVLVEQRFHPPPPAIRPLLVYRTPDPAHKQAAILVNKERRRLGLAEDATRDNWAELLVEMRRQHEMWIDVHVTPARAMYSA